MLGLLSSLRGVNQNIHTAIVDADKKFFGFDLYLERLIAGIMRSLILFVWAALEALVLSETWLGISILISYYLVPCI